jgi:hypothetical protein
MWFPDFGFGAFEVNQDSADWKSSLSSEEKMTFFGSVVAISCLS